jgi:hypothetical protein
MLLARNSLSLLLIGMHLGVDHASSFPSLLANSLNASPTATPTETPTPTGTPTETAAPTDALTPTDAVTDATQTVADSGIDSLLSAPPGALFFAGGAVVIAAATVWWYWTRYRPMYGA